jgi:hypothetical protein
MSIVVLGNVLTSNNTTSMNPNPWGQITTTIDSIANPTSWYWNTTNANTTAPINDMPITFKYLYTALLTETLKVYILVDNLCNFYFNGNIQLIDINGAQLGSMDIAGSISNGLFTSSNKVFSVNVESGKTYTFEFDCCNIIRSAGLAVWCQGPDGSFRFNTGNAPTNWSSFIRNTSGFFVGTTDLYSLFDPYPNVTTFVTRSLVKQASNIGGLSLSDIFAPIVMGSNSLTIPISTYTTIQYFINLYNATSYSYTFGTSTITVPALVTDISSNFIITLTASGSPVAITPSITVYNGTIAGNTFNATIASALLH